MESTKEWSEKTPCKSFVPDGTAFRHAELPYAACRRSVDQRDLVAEKLLCQIPGSRFAQRDMRVGLAVLRNDLHAGLAREILFTVVPREAKYKAKNVIDTVVYRGGDAVSGWLVAALRG